MNYRFPRKLRLIDSSQFDRVFGARKKALVGPFVIYHCDNDLGYARLGTGVSKKNVKKASDRNCFKRIIKEWFRTNKESLKGKDVLVFVNNKAKEVSKKEAAGFLKGKIL